MALSGRINIDALRNLNGLQSLDLSSNFFSGSLPEFNRIRGLKSLVLSENLFSGEIPGDYFASMGSLTEELHLDGNQFSGKIPPIDGHKLDWLELSYNRLVGEIPWDLSRFPVSSFRGNLGLCGKPLGPCADETGPKTPAQSPLPRKPDWMTDEMLEALSGRFDEAAAEVLGNGAVGSSYKAVMSNGLSVIVKRLRDMTAVDKEDFDVAMTRFGTLRHPNILTPLAYHYRREEKLLVSQFMPKGSLSYVLHGDREAGHDSLNWPTRLKIVRGIARGLGFLHSEFSTYDLPHGNLKSVNVLLTDTYEAVLNDYAFHPLVDTPLAPQVLQAYRAPESSYRLPEYGRGGTDVVEWARSSILQQQEVDIIDPVLAKDLPSSKNRMMHLLYIGAACSESDPDRRPSITEAIRKIEEV
ncbi:hypothetical protein MLD38_006200 [Melastoma candidum]|uniref:Uncharacterized protein n=1 Tax=Melastoma candidum TaxID=119954 RepID=A0ACB9RM59_9MYRT|nr:hypothetical protein MLD38_006200 [Melastoma candidum]